METKYSKGKWILHLRASACVIRENDGRVIANCASYTTNMDGGKHVDENFANAKLIAAAPELLEALKELMPLIETVPSFLQFKMIDEKEKNNFYELLKNANNAIKKATE